MHAHFSQATSPLPHTYIYAHIHTTIFTFQKPTAASSLDKETNGQRVTGGLDYHESESDHEAYSPFTSSTADSEVEETRRGEDANRGDYYGDDASFESDDDDQ
jgi:hypothetical protein